MLSRNKVDYVFKTTECALCFLAYGIYSIPFDLEKKNSS